MLCTNLFQLDNIIVTPDQNQLLMNLNRKERLTASDSENDASLCDSVATCTHDGTFCVCQT